MSDAPPREQMTPLFDAGEESPPAVLREMSLEFGNRTIARVLDSAFASDVPGPWAMEMHRRFLSPTHCRWQGFALMTEITAPPTGWEVLARWARRASTEMARKVREGDRHEARAMARLALKIEGELARLANHPAFCGSSVLGVEPMVLGAFRMSSDDGEMTGPPAPTPALAMDRFAAELPDRLFGETGPGLMRPYAYKVRGQTYTTWLWQGE